MLGGSCKRKPKSDDIVCVMSGSGSPPSADSSLLAKDFCPAGFSGFLAQIFDEALFHGRSIPSTFFLPRTTP